MAFETVRHSEDSIDTITRGEWAKIIPLPPPAPRRGSGPAETAVAFDWREFAACKGMGPAVFFPLDSRYQEARRVCRDCPVQEPCLSASSVTVETREHGMWGGLTPPERKRRLSAAEAWNRAVARGEHPAGSGGMCENCGGEFEPSSVHKSNAARQRFCSHRCANNAASRAYYRRNRARIVARKKATRRRGSGPGGAA